MERSNFLRRNWLHMKEKNNLIFDCLILIIAREKPSKKRAEKYLFGHEETRGTIVGRVAMG